MHALLPPIHRKESFTCEIIIHVGSASHSPLHPKHGKELFTCEIIIFIEFASLSPHHPPLRAYHTFSKVSLVVSSISIVNTWNRISTDFGKFVLT